jgi:hypothetical protein
MAKKLTTDEEIKEPPGQRRKRELRNTLLGDPRIKVLYFDKAGNHFFRSFQADNGKKYSRFHVEYAKDARGQTIRTEKPLPENEITETISAENWLKNNS